MVRAVFFIAALLPAACSLPRENIVKISLHPRLEAYVASFLPECEKIPDARRKELGRIAAFVREGKASKLIFICTHNSRRSHLSQIWAAVAAAYYGLDGIRTYSGGTEATAFNPRAVAALERAGFVVEKGEGANPRYRVSFSPGADAQECFSKRYDDSFNPSGGFVAVMTCSSADAGCPVVPGAVLRVAVPYVDPKGADGTPGEAAAYDERCRQIAAEMFYLFSQAK